MAFFTLKMRERKEKEITKYFVINKQARWWWRTMKKNCTDILLCYKSSRSAKVIFFVSFHMCVRARERVFYSVGVFLLICLNHIFSSQECLICLHQSQLGCIAGVGFRLRQLLHPRTDLGHCQVVGCLYLCKHNKIEERFTLSHRYVHSLYY
jgi:hypothetical protein